MRRGAGVLALASLTLSCSASTVIPSVSSLGSEEFLTGRLYYRVQTLDAEAGPEGPWLTQTIYHLESSRSGISRLERLTPLPSGSIVGERQGGVRVFNYARNAVTSFDESEPNPNERAIWPGSRTRLRELGQVEMLGHKTAGVLWQVEDETPAGVQIRIEVEEWSLLNGGLHHPLLVTQKVQHDGVLRSLTTTIVTDLRAAENRP